MFDLDPGKLIVIGIVALIAIPSKDLPRVLRTLGQMVGKMRRMSAEFQGQFMDAMREMEVADLQKEIEETNKAVMEATKPDHAFDPLTEARKQITTAVDGETRSAASIQASHAEAADLGQDESAASPPDDDTEASDRDGKKAAP